MDDARSGVQLGIRQKDVEALATAILQDDGMNIPMVPDAVQRVIYQSAIKLTYNLFYKGVSQLDGQELIPSHTGSKGSRELRIDRVHLEQGGQASMSAQQYGQWACFQSKLDLIPLENFASALVQNKAVNITLIPDKVEKDIYYNCLKVIFWVLDKIANTLKVTFCGHTIAMDFAAASRSYLVSRDGTGKGVVKVMTQISSFMVNAQTIEDFQGQATALLQMDGSFPGATMCNRSSAVKNGLSWMKSSLNTVQQEMVQKLNVSLYGLILAILEDCLKSTKIEVLNDQISLRVSTSSQANGAIAHTERHENPRESHLNSGRMDDLTLAAEASLASLDFTQERALLQRRFREWSPQERLLILNDLSS
jgi:hypothetical protein